MATLLPGGPLPACFWAGADLSFGPGQPGRPLQSGADGVTGTWPKGALLRMIPGLLATAGALGPLLTFSQPGQTTALGLTRRQFAESGVHVGPPSGSAPGLDRFTAAQAAARLQLGEGWSLNRAALPPYQASFRSLT